MLSLQVISQSPADPFDGHCILVLPLHASSPLHFNDNDDDPLAGMVVSEHDDFPSQLIEQSLVPQRNVDVLHESSFVHSIVNDAVVNPWIVESAHADLAPQSTVQSVALSQSKFDTLHLSSPAQLYMILITLKSFNFVST